MTKYSLTAGVIVERVGDDLMVVVPGNSDVVSLSGRPAEMLLDVKTGRKVDSSDPALRDLVDLGVISAPGLSRRGLIRVGAVGAGAGIAVLAMPGVAAASSTSGGGNTSSATAVLLLTSNLWNGSGHDLGRFKLGLEGLNADFSQPATVTLSDGTTIIPMTADTHPTGGVTIDAFDSGFLSTVIPGSSWYSLTHTIAFTTVGGGSATATFTASAPPAPPPS